MKEHIHVSTIDMYDENEFINMLLTLPILFLKWLRHSEKY